jgi:hypothetical protein
MFDLYISGLNLQTNTMKKTVKLFSLIGILVFLYSCRKADSLKSTNVVQGENSAYQHRNGELFQHVVAYLEDYQDTVSAHQSSKIDTLLQNLSDSNLMVISLDDTTDIYVCDLIAYKNPSVPEYSNTFYKALFTAENGQITYGQYFTIYTDMTKQGLDENLDEIISYESNAFTGVIATNSLSDQFFQEQVYADGKIIGSAILSPYDEEGQRDGGEECTTLWLVTTTIWSNGSIDKEWELLGTFCDGCIPTGTRISSFHSDCDPDAGGGGGNPTETTANGCFNYYIQLGDNQSCGVSMKHCWRGTSIWGPFGYSYGVDVDHATPDQTYLDCTYLGRPVKRRAWPATHHPNIFKAGNRRFQITWNYLLYYNYTFLDATGGVSNTGSTPIYLKRVVNV